MRNENGMLTEIPKDIANAMLYGDGRMSKKEWIDVADEVEKMFKRHYYVCPHCDHRATYFVGGTENWWCTEAPNYCPHCGDPMKEDTVTMEVKHDVLTKDDIKDIDPEDNVFADAAESLKQTIALVKEDQEKFIFEAITPFLREINEIVIPKRVLERALTTFKEEHTAEWKVLMKEYGGTGVYDLY